MAKMPWWQDSLLALNVSILGFLFKLMPNNVAMLLGRILGTCGYFLMPRKTRIIYLNLKIATAGKYTHHQLKQMTRAVYSNLVCSFIELLCIDKIAKSGVHNYVKLVGTEHIQHALSKGKGVIFAAVHGGNWELASLAGSLLGHSYYIIVNRQAKSPQLDKLLLSCRQSSGAGLIIAGEDTKELVKAIKNNSILSITVDQGGKEGVILPFLGKSASFATGAVRLAMKYGCSLCPVWMHRTEKGHVLQAFDPIIIEESLQEEKDIRHILAKVVAFLEPQFKESPTDYFWFYKFFKYTDRRLVVMLDDGRTGHLRQSQAMAKSLQESGVEQKLHVRCETVKVAYRGQWARHVLNGFGLLGCFLPIVRGRWMLACTLTPETVARLDTLKPDVLVSTGSTNGSVLLINAWINQAKSVAILHQGLIPLSRFDRVVLPVHDGQARVNARQLIRPLVAPNLINKVYLKNNVDGLLNRYSHLKSDVRLKFGVLIGGDTKGVKTNPDAIRQLITHLKRACEHYNAILLLTTSRRTPEAIEQLIARELQDFKRTGLCIMANQHNVPEAVGGILGLAEVVFVSSESISMVSEAVCAGKMTMVYSLTGNYQPQAQNKYERFIMTLQQQGFVTAPNMNDVPANLAMLMTRKVVLKSLDDSLLIKKGLEGII